MALKNYNEIIIKIVSILWVCVGVVSVEGMFQEEGESSQRMVMGAFQRQRAPQDGESKGSDFTIGQDAQENQSIEQASWDVIDMPQSVQTRQILEEKKEVQDVTNRMPYEMVPERGQEKVKKSEVTVSEGKKQVTLDQEEPVETMDKLMQWVVEVTTAMMSYSGEHLDRDKRNASRYFTPEAWKVVERELFADPKSPLARLFVSRGSSRGMSVDWPKSLHEDVGQRGRIWWFKVPIMVLIKEDGKLKRAFYEISVGVVSRLSRQVQGYVVDDVVIKSVDVQEKRVKKRGRNAR